MRFRTFSEGISYFSGLLERQGRRVHTEKWQGIDISKKPEAEMHEFLNLSLTCEMPSETLGHYQDQIKPNLPWADDHFLERIGGEPLNPGEQWAKWPYAHSADKFRDQPGRQFDHTYMERYWPRHAGQTPGGLGPFPEKGAVSAHRGIRWEYGDLNDVVELLVREPQTRQAFIPMFFPEDTGMRHGGRAPCSVGYHLIMRQRKLHMVYYLRSCDFMRHFRDDLYLTIRLLLWFLDRLRHQPGTGGKPDALWGQVTPGDFTVHITSLHIFRNDYIQLFGAK